MTALYKIFSSRELATIFYLALAVVFLLLSKGFRPQLLNLLKSLFGSTIGFVLLIKTIYICLVIYFLFLINFWNTTLLKDTIFWYFASALLLFFQINKAKETTFFKNLVKENLKWAIIIEFILNFYTFNIWTELIILPIMTLLSLMIAYSEQKQEYALTNKVLKYMVSIIGLTFFIIVTYKTFKNYSDILTIQNLFSFLLPPIMTILIIPFLYLLALYMGYENLFVRTRTMCNDSKKISQIKKQILLTANFNLNRLNKISSRINKFDVYHSENLPKLIKSVIKD